MDKKNQSKANTNNGVQIKTTSTQNKINLDYDFNTEYGDGDIPDVDKPGNKKNNAEEN